MTFRNTLAAICGLFILTGIFTILTPVSAQTTCNAYSSGTPPPQGFGAAWNVLSSGKELLLNSNCQTNSVIFKTGSGSNNQFVYKKGYYYTTSWQTFDFQGTPAQGSKDWLIGQGTFTQNSLPSGTQFWVAYICQWDANAKKWKCGCSDAACAQSLWQLQGARPGGSPVPPGGTGACMAPKDDLFKNPFNKNSAHHRPIGTGAEYASDTDPTTLALKKGDHIVDKNFLFGIRMAVGSPIGNVVARVDASDPTATVGLRAVREGSVSDIPTTVRVPKRGPSVFRLDTLGKDDSESAICDMSTELCHIFYQFAYENNGYVATIHVSTPLKGLGHTPDKNIGATGMSVMFGLMRGFEINTPGFKLQHAAQIALPSRSGDCASANMLGTTYVWPGKGVDHYAKSTNSGPIPYGALLALPPESKGGPNLNSLGLSEPGKRFAEQLRDYGAYVVDNFWCTHIRADQEVNNTVKSQVEKDSVAIYPYLRMVKNNAEDQTVSGGGDPIAPNCALDAQ